MATRPSLALLTLLAGMRNDCVRSREHEACVAVVETHQVRRLPARSADLDDLAHPLWLSYHVATHVQPVPDSCLHPPTSSPAFPRNRCAGGHAHGVRVATTSIHLGAER